MSSDFPSTRPFHSHAVRSAANTSDRKSPSRLSQMCAGAPDTRVDRARFSHSSGDFGVTLAGGVSPVIAVYVAPCASDAPVPACGFTSIQHGTGPAIIGRKMPVRIAPTAFQWLAGSTQGKSQCTSRSTFFAASTSSFVGSSGTGGNTNPSSGARYVLVIGSYPSTATIVPSRCRIGLFAIPCRGGSGQSVSGRFSTSRTIEIGGYSGRSRGTPSLPTLTESQTATRSMTPRSPCSVSGRIVGRPYSSRSTRTGPPARRNIVGGSFASVTARIARSVTSCMWRPVSVIVGSRTSLISCTSSTPAPSFGTETGTSRFPRSHSHSLSCLL